MAEAIMEAEEIVAEEAEVDVEEDAAEDENMEHTSHLDDKEVQ